jgi:putative intracellular protease/amidase
MRVLVVVAQRYNGHELWTALGVLQEEGIDFDVVSTSTIIADEITREPNTINRTLDDVESLEGFDGLMFVSGNMQDTESYWTDHRTLTLVEEAKIKDLPLAAICCSVPTVRNATKGKRVSFYPLVRSRLLLEEAGALTQSVSISVDGNLVTAEHQMATQVWAESFAKVIKQEPAEIDLRDSGYVPKGKSERRLHPRLEKLRGKGIHPKNMDLIEEYHDNDQ